MRGFTWIVDGQVAAMPRPWPEHVAALPALGVGGVISLTEDVPRGLPHPDLLSLHLPVRDFHPPTQEQLRRAVAFIDALVESGTAAAVHCTAGLGRTGTIVSAWMIHRGSGVAEAIAAVRRRRPGSVETMAQEAALAEFARSLGRD